MHTHTYTLHAHTHAGTQTRAHVHIYLRETHMLTHTYTYTRMPGLDTCIHTHTSHAHNTHMLSCMLMHSPARHTLTCILCTCVHTHVYMHACLHTHTRTRTSSTTSTWPSGSHLCPSCAGEETVRDKAQPWGCWLGKGSEVPNGTQMSRSAEPQDLVEVEDTQHCPAASPPGALVLFMKAELPSSALSFRSYCMRSMPRRPSSSGRTHSPPGRPSVVGAMQPRVVSSRGGLGAAENGAVTSGDSGLHSRPHTA